MKPIGRTRGTSLKIDVQTKIDPQALKEPMGGGWGGLWPQKCSRIGLIVVFSVSHETYWWNEWVQL